MYKEGEISHVVSVVAVLQDCIQKLPPTVDTLFVQVDGCNDNINIAVMCYLQLLVEAGRFKEIQLHRLPVGHIHEDIGKNVIYYDVSE